MDTGTPNWLPEKEWGPRLLPSWQSKDFQRSTSDCGKFQARGGGRDSTVFPWGLFSGRLFRTWRLYPRGTAPNAAVPEQRTYCTQENKHPRAAIKRQHEQVSVEFTTPRAHLAYTSAILANGPPRRRQHVALSCEESMQHLQLI